MIAYDVTAEQMREACAQSAVIGLLVGLALAAFLLAVLRRK